MAVPAGWIDPATGQWIPNFNSGAPETAGTITPAAATPAPTPEPDKPDFRSPPQTDAQREQELRDALAAAERNRQIAEQDGQDLTDFDNSVRDVAAKVGVIDEYKAAGQPMPEGTREVIYGKVAPFTDLAKETINLEGAIKAGVSDEALQRAGVSQIAIVQTRQAIRQQQQNREIEGKVEQIRGEDLARDYVDIGSDTYIRRDDWDALTPEYRAIAKTKGYDAMVAAIEADYQTAVKAELVQSFDRFKEKDGKLNLGKAINSGVSAHTIEVTFGKDAAAAAIKSAAVQKKLRFSNAVFAGVEFAGQMVVPGYATVKNWNQMSGGAKALSIAIDAVTLVPLVGSAARGARAAKGITRAARMSSAAEGVAGELTAQIRAPIDMVLHPIATVKGTARAGRDLLENVANLRKIPEGILTTSEHTVRIPVTSNMTKAEAIKLGDRIMDVAAREKSNVIVELNGQSFELPRSPLMQELGGGVAHSSPFGELLKPGTKIQEGGLFVAQQPMPRFARTTSTGASGQEHVVLIFGPKEAEKLASSNKLYQGTRELEKIFPEGYVINQPKQHLFTRIGPDKMRVDIFLDVEKPLSVRQIAKLKGMAFVEDLKAPFKPSLYISGTADDAARLAGKRKGITIEHGLTPDETDDLVRMIRRSGNVAEARNLARVGQVVRQQGRAPARAGRYAGDVAAEIRITRPGDRRVERVPIRVTGTPTARVPRSAPDTRRGTDIPLTPRREVPRSEDAERIERIAADLPRDVRLDVVRRTDTGRIERVPPDRVQPPRRDVPRIDRPPRFDVPERREPPIPERPNKGQIPRYRRGKPTDEQKRDIIRDPRNTAFAWVQGKLRGEPVFHVGVIKPNNEVVQLTVVGPAPQGAIRATGPGQSMKSITMTTRGQLRQPVRLEGGALDPVITPVQGERKVAIRFVKDETNRERAPKEKPLFSINRNRGSRGGRGGRDLGADIVSDRRGRHLRL
jgi:hypothetical protein